MTTARNENGVLVSVFYGTHGEGRFSVVNYHSTDYITSRQCALGLIASDIQ